jgi:NAD-specific glutamate dehydrogenase
VVGTVRDTDGGLVDVVKSRGADHRESFQHYELVETLDADAVAELSDALARLLGAVRTVVSDFRPMQSAVETMIGYARDDADHFSSTRSSTTTDRGR